MKIIFVIFSLDMNRGDGVGSVERQYKPHWVNSS